MLLVLVESQVRSEMNRTPSGVTFLWLQRSLEKVRFYFRYIKLGGVNPHQRGCSFHLRQIRSEL